MRHHLFNQFVFLLKHVLSGKVRALSCATSFRMFCPNFLCVGVSIVSHPLDHMETTAQIIPGTFIALVTALSVELCLSSNTFIGLQVKFIF